MCSPVCLVLWLGYEYVLYVAFKLEALYLKIALSVFVKVFTRRPTSARWNDETQHTKLGLTLGAREE